MSFSKHVDWRREVGDEESGGVSEEGDKKSTGIFNYNCFYICIVTDFFKCNNSAEKV